MDVSEAIKKIEKIVETLANKYATDEEEDRYDYPEEKEKCALDAMKEFLSLVKKNVKGIEATEDSEHGPTVMNLSLNGKSLGYVETYSNPDYDGDLCFARVHYNYEDAEFY